MPGMEGTLGPIDVTVDMQALNPDLAVEGGSWLKSSSSAAGNCLTVNEKLTAVGDTKTGQTLDLGREAITAFIEGVKADEFDNLAS